MSAVSIASQQIPYSNNIDILQPLMTGHCKRLFEYWSSLKRNEFLPGRLDFNPAEILDIITHIIILELPVLSQVTFRLLGSAHNKRMGGDFAGTNFLDFVPEGLRAVRAGQFWSAVSQPCGIRIIRRGVSLEMLGQDYELVFLPIQPRHPGQPLQMIGVGCPLKGNWRTGSEQFLAHTSDYITFIDLGAGSPENPASLF